MSEGRLDPVAVREARGFVAHWLTLPTMTPEERDAIRIILAFLDEEREASAPFAAPDGLVPSDEEYRRLAAFHALFPEPEEKNDGA